jgi:hypothetical protein
MFGNAGNGYARISRVPEAPLEGTLSYSTTELTNQDVIVTLTLNQSGTVIEG